MQNILVPVDGSKFGEQAMPVAAMIAARTNGRLHLAHVLVPLVVGDPMMQYMMVDVETTDDAREYLKDLIARTPTLSASRPVTEILEGSVTDALRDYAANHQIDLIVMTTHAHGPLLRAWMGSVSDDLIHAVNAPILLLRAEDEQSAEPVKPLRRVLIAIDGTPQSELVLGPAGELARAFGASVTLLRVIPPTQSKSRETPTQPPTVQDLHLVKNRDETAEHELDRLAAWLRQQGLTVDCRVTEHESPRKAILQAANDLDCDLIALETHGRTGLGRMFLGSVTDKVVREAKCPVLVHCRHEK